MQERYIQQLTSAIHQSLKNSSDGQSEYSLIQVLRKQSFFKGLDTSGDPLALFEVHFLVFHCLYRMQRDLLKNDAVYVEIDPLNIRLIASGDARGQIGPSDPLAEYYLDLDNLCRTNRQDIDVLLDNFWEAFCVNQQRADALRILGLDEPASNTDIKSAYKSLVSRHHPDRGGDKEKIQQINEAYRVLSAY